MEESLQKIKCGNFLFINIEYIQVTSLHQCVRKMYMMSKDGSFEFERDFFPCKRFQDLDEKFQHSTRARSAETKSFVSERAERVRECMGETASETARSKTARALNCMAP